MSNKYTVSRWPDGTVQATVNNRPLRHVVVHSPTGFEMGYGGSGPADLALSILCHELNLGGVTGPFFKSLGMSQGRSPLIQRAQRAWRLHQLFKQEVIAKHKNLMQIDSEAIQAWIAAAESLPFKKT